MSTTIRSTPAAATGAVFAVVLTVANGDGGTLSAPRHLAATAALTLLIPFVVYVGAVLRARTANATDAWLATTAVAAGVVGAGLKLLSDVPELAKSGHGVPTADSTSATLTALADSTTILALAPLALFGLAVGASALRTGALPRWLGVGAVVTGVSLTVNGCFLHTENVPAFLVLALWCLLTSVHLVRASRRESIVARSASVAAT